MGSRRIARELTLQLLYSSEISGDPLDAVLSDVGAWRHFPPEALSYAEVLAHAVLQHQEESDRFIRETVTNWEISRIALLDRIILRMGICELLYMDDVPHRVAIDEAIELAKKYSSEKAGGFINGILDSVLKKTMETGSAIENQPR